MFICGPPRLKTMSKYIQKVNCHKKKAYGAVGDAKGHIKDVYLRTSVLLSVYECPICLDFHLTKIPNEKIIGHYTLSTEFRTEAFKHWFPKWKRPEARILVRQRISFMMRRILSSKVQKTSGTKLENTLPLAQQKQALLALKQLHGVRG